MRAPSILIFAEASMLHRTCKLGTIVVCLLLPNVGSAQDSSKVAAKESGFPLASVPRVGEVIYPPQTKEQTQCVVESAQTWPCFFGLVDGVLYQVAYKSDYAGASLVMDVRTNDTKFRLPDGVKIGDVFVASSRNDLIVQPYFAVYGNAKGDWVPVVGELDQICIAQEGKEDEFRPAIDLNFSAGSQLRLRIMGFAQRKGIEHK